MTQTAVGGAFRNLRRAPAFTGLVVLTLALGIGSTTAMCSVVDAVLIGLIAIAATALPAIRAPRVDPMTTLRAE